MAARLILWRWRAQQVHEQFVKLVEIQIILYFHWPHLAFWLIVFGPAQRIAVSRAAVEVYVHEESFLLRDNAGIEPRYRRQFIPKIIVVAAQARVLAYVTGRRRIANF